MAEGDESANCAGTAANRGTRFGMRYAKAYAKADAKFRGNRSSGWVSAPLGERGNIRDRPEIADAAATQAAEAYRAQGKYIELVGEVIGSSCRLLSAEIAAVDVPRSGRVCGGWWDASRSAFDGRTRSTTMLHAMCKPWVCRGGRMRGRAPMWPDLRRRHHWCGSRGW